MRVAATRSGVRVHRVVRTSAHRWSVSVAGLSRPATGRPFDALAAARGAGRAAAPSRGRLIAAGLLALAATALPAPLGSAPQRSATTQDDRRREVAVTVTDTGFEPARIDARLNEIVAVTLTASGTPHGFGLDAYRIAKRVEPGKTLHFEFRADTVGTFPFYCSLTGADGRPHEERGQLVVRR